MLVPLSASHAHSLANLRKTPDEVVAEVGRIRAARDAAGAQDAASRAASAPPSAARSRARSSRPRCCACMQALLDAGADRVSLADTVGYADPAHGARPVRAGAARSPASASGCGHFHDTRGLGARQRVCGAGRPASPASTPPSPASAAARMRRARAATSPPKTSPSCSPAWARHRHRPRRAARAARQGRAAGWRARPCTARSGAPACRRHSTHSAGRARG